MTSNLSVIRRLDEFIEECKARKFVEDNTTTTYDNPTIRRLLSELPGYCDNYYVDEDTFDGYIEAIVMHPDFGNDKELDYRIAMFKAEPSASSDLALRGAMIVYQWMSTTTFC